MIEKPKKSIFWMTGMIIAYEGLFFIAGVVAFWIFLFILAFTIKLEIIEKIFNNQYFFVSTWLLLLFMLFVKVFGIKYGVYYIFSKAPVSLNAVKTIIKWYVVVHLVSLIFSLISMNTFSIALFSMSVITGSFLIWYFFKNTIGILKS